MNFIEAVDAMKKGKKVRRKSWSSPNRYIVRNDNDPEFQLSTGVEVKITLIMIEATDWEIFEEKPKTLYSKRRETSCVGTKAEYREEEIKEAVQRIKALVPTTLQSVLLKIVGKELVK